MEVFIDDPTGLFLMAPDLHRDVLSGATARGEAGAIRVSPKWAASLK